MVQDERPPGRVSLVQSWYRPALATQIEVSVKVTFRNMGKVVFGSEWFGVTQEEMMKETEHIIQAIDRIGAERWNEGR